MAEEPIIRGIDAHKTYNSGPVTVHALRGVNLEIPRGEMVAIMGPSGCGKTTLLNCFSGLHHLTSGDVQIEGVSLSGMDDDAKSRYRSRRMGFVFQSYNLLPVLTAAENVELPLLVAKVPAKDARRKALVLMEQVELNGWAGHKPAQLSAGQQQRVAIARALVNDPAIVWADEPTGNLDSETSAQIMDLLVRLNREQRQTLVLVTHDAIVSSRAHRILRMRNGQIVEETGGSRSDGHRRHRGPRGPRGDRPRGRHPRRSPPPGPPRGAEHPAANVPSPNRPRGFARRHRGHLVELGRRRHFELHLPRGRLRPARRDRRNRVERVQRPTDLLLRGQRDPGCRGPRGLASADRRPRADAPEGHAGSQRHRQQRESTDYGNGTRRVPGGRLRAADGPRRFVRHHGFPERLRRVCERTGGGGPECDRRPTAHPGLRDDEPDLGPRDGGRDATELFLVMGAFGILAGILLIVNIFVMLAEERKPELGIARALGFLRRDLLATFALEGTFYAVVAAALGSLAGVGLGYVMVYFFDKLVPHGQVPVTFHFDASSVLTSFVAGTALTWATILVASWRVSRLNIVRAIRDLPEPGTPERSRDALAAGLLAAVAGLALTAWGFLANTGLGKIPGPPLLSLGLGIVVASRGHARAALTIASAFNLVWILVPVGLLNQQTDNVSIAFVMTGIILVGSAILIAVFNVSEALRSLLRRANRGAGRPVLSTAVSYPSEKRFRTGMTVAMFALILFMVTLISMVQGLQASSLDTFVRQQPGGYDVIAYTTSYGEIPNFRQILRENFTDLHGTLLGGENGVSSASVLPAKVETAGGNRSYDYTLWGIDNFLIRSNGYGFTSFLPSFVNESTGRSESLTDRTQVWLSLRYNHTLAIVDRTAAGPNQFVPDSSRLRA